MEVKEATLREALNYIQEVCNSVSSEECYNEECIIFKILGKCCSMEDAPESWKVNECNNE